MADRAVYYSTTVLWHITQDSIGWLRANAMDYYMDGPFVQDIAGAKRIAGTINFKHEADLLAFLLAHKL